MIPDMKTIMSVNIASLGYSKDERKLYVQYYSGAIVRYSEISKYDYETILSSSCIGTYIRSHIEGAYDSERIY